jgi:hypothetical protein
MRTTLPDWDRLIGSANAPNRASAYRPPASPAKPQDSVKTAHLYRAVS